MVDASVIAASMCRREPQRGQFKTSFAKTLKINWAQVNFGPTAGWFGSAPEASPLGSARRPLDDGGRGTTWSRRGEAGAKQPW